MSMKHGKLVRDRIPDIIREHGETPVTHVASDDEYWQRLLVKLREEVDEFIDTPTTEELADIQEVIDAIYDFKGFDRTAVEEQLIEKRERRGGFTRRIVLDGTR